MYVCVAVYVCVFVFVCGRIHIYIKLVYDLVYTVHLK